MLNELHLIQYYYNYPYEYLYTVNTVNIHSIMLHKCVNTEIVVGSL